MPQKIQEPRGTSKKMKAAVKAKPGTTPSVAKVPPEAENFEHTIRRMIKERDQRRLKNVGLYL